VAKLRHRLVFSICVQTYNDPLTEGWCDENNITDDPTVWLDLYQRGWRGRKTPTPQQQKMTDCNQQASAKTLKGDERKTFMSQCLKKRPRPRKERAHASAAENARLQQSGFGKITEGR
jgi:hypothetical protein